MPLTVVTGPANAGKTGAAYGTLRRAIDAGRSPVLLLPSDPDVQRAQSELLVEIPLGIRISTFDRHIATTWLQHGDGRKLISALEREALLSRLVNNANLEYSGLIPVATQAIEHLCDMCGTSWRNLGPGHGAAQRLSDILMSYAGSLEATGLVELAEALSILAASDKFGGDPIVAHRFTDLTHAQESFLTAASSAGVEVVVTLPWVAGFPATKATTPLLERLTVTGRHLVVDEAPVSTTRELERVAEGLFLNPTPGNENSAVAFFEADGDENEAAIIAEQVAQALGDVHDAREVAVVYRNPGLHVESLTAALDALDIVADYDIRRPITATPFGRAYLQLLDYAIGGDLTALIGFVRSPFSGAKTEQASRFERDARSVRHTDRKHTVRILERHAAAAAREVSDICRLAATGIEASSVADVIRSLHRMLGHAYGRRAAAPYGELADDARVVEAIAEVAESISSTGEVPLEISVFRDMLARYEVTSGDVERLGHVQVTSVERARSRRFDIVIIGGMEAGEFPAVTDDLFMVGGAVDELLKSCGAGSRRRLGPDYERLLFYQAVTRPRSRLVLIRRRLDSDGTPVAASVFWEELLDFYRSPTADDLSPTECPSALAVDATPQEVGARGILRAAASCCVAGEYDRVSAAILRGAPVLPEISDSHILEQLASREVFAPSEIEAYLACPLKWFFHRVVAPRRLDYEFDPLERGRLAHSMLKTAYEAIASSVPDHRVLESNLTRCRAVARRVCEEQLAEAPPSLDIEETWERRALTEAIDEFVVGDATLLPSEFTPYGLEITIGEESGVDLGEFRLHGRVDRVDSNGAEAVIIDYKTGSVPTRSALLDSGKVQLHLYAEMVRKELDLIPVGAVYWSLKDGKARGLVDCDRLGTRGFAPRDCGDHAQFENEVELAIAAAETAVAGIRAGHIMPEPKSGSCDWCAARGYCQRLSS